MCPSADIASRVKSWQRLRSWPTIRIQVMQRSMMQCTTISVDAVLINAFEELYIAHPRHGIPRSNDEQNDLYFASYFSETWCGCRRGIGDIGIPLALKAFKAVLRQNVLRLLSTS
jgi:hypothetical protein